jgi:hypothetical protein
MGWFGKKKAADVEGGVELVWSRNMALRVAAPKGVGWQRMEAAPQHDGLLAAIKCVRGAPPDALALDAFVYAAETLPTLEQLQSRDWQAHFEQKMFASVESVSVETVDHLARGGGFSDQAVEVRVRGTLREPSMPLMVRERHVSSGGKLLVVSVSASPAVHDREAKTVESWISHAMIGGE